MKKWTQKTVSEYVNTFGYTLIVGKNEEFDESKIFLECPQRHIYQVSLRTFLRGCRCKTCMHINSRTSEEDVRKYIEEAGYQLLSKYEIDIKKILVRCPNGHEYYVKFSNFKNGKRCAKCKNTKKYTYEEIKNFIELNRYKLISKKYINANSIIIVECDKGHIYSTSFSRFKNGKSRCRICLLENRAGKNHPNWKGGVTKKKLALYDTYAPQIDWCEEVRRDPKDKNVLQVRCYESNCRKWFTPTRSEVYHRIRALKSSTLGEQHFYCSNKCKHRCTIYGKRSNINQSKTNSNNLNREVQPELRQLVFERDDYRCQKCGSEEDIQCHHIIPVKLDPIESADIDNCITLCKQCHKKVHKIVGCKYGELKNIC